MKNTSFIPNLLAAARVSWADHQRVSGNSFNSGLYGDSELAALNWDVAKALLANFLLDRLKCEGHGRCKKRRHLKAEL
jgi:hypothetical protein